MTTKKGAYYEAKKKWEGLTNHFSGKHSLLFDNGGY